MATVDTNFTEIQRRGYLWTPNTTLDDGNTALTYDGDPNDATGSTPGEVKLGAMPYSSQYCESDGTL